MEPALTGLHHGPASSIDIATQQEVSLNTPLGLSLRFVLYSFTSISSRRPRPILRGQAQGGLDRVLRQQGGSQTEPTYRLNAQQADTAAEATIEPHARRTCR